MMDLGQGWPTEKGNKMKTMRNIFRALLVVLIGVGMASQAVAQEQALAASQNPVRVVPKVPSLAEGMFALYLSGYGTPVEIPMKKMMGVLTERITGVLNDPSGKIRYKIQDGPIQVVPSGFSEIQMPGYSRDLMQKKVGGEFMLVQLLENDGDWTIRTDDRKIMNENLKGVKDRTRYELSPDGVPMFSIVKPLDRGRYAIVCSNPARVGYYFAFEVK